MIKSIINKIHRPITSAIIISLIGFGAGRLSATPEINYYKKLYESTNILNKAYVNVIDQLFDKIEELKKEK